MSVRLKPVFPANPSTLGPRHSPGLQHLVRLGTGSTQRFCIRHSGQPDKAAAMTLTAAAVVFFSWTTIMSEVGLWLLSSQEAHP